MESVFATILRGWTLNSGNVTYMSIQQNRVIPLRGKIHDRLQKLVQIETPSGNVEASGHIADVLAAGYEDLGAHIRRITSENGTHLLIDIPGRPETAPLLLVGHSDTVWPLGTLNGRVPWAEDGDRISGPGVYDMKNGLVCIETALHLAGKRRRATRVLITCDEEIGSPTSRELVVDAAQGCSAAIGFESPHPDGALKVGRRGSTRFELQVTGREAHAALNPDDGVSAIDELVDQLLAVRALVSRASETSEVLCNVGTISGGRRANVIAGEARAELGLRFLDGASERAVLSALEHLRPIRVGAVLSPRVLTNRPAWAASDADRRWTAQIGAIAQGIGGELDGRPAAGAGDANLLGAVGAVPTVDGFGAPGGGAHAENEHISFTGMLERIELLTAVLEA